MVRTAQRVTTLLERWRAQSLATGWPGPAEGWETPAVETVCAVLAARTVSRPMLTQSCQALGESRALASVPLADARADLDVGVSLSDAAAWVRVEAADALTVGWATVSAESTGANVLLDPATGYAGPGYLHARLREVYAEALFLGELVADTHALVVVSFEADAVHVVTQERLGVVQAALRYAFIGGETVVALDHTRGAVLATRADPRFSDSLAVLRSELRIAQNARRLPSARVWIVTLPSDQRHLSAVLRDVLG